MGKINVDFSNTGDGFSPIGAGRYAVRIKDWKQEEGTKAPYIQWTLQITSGDSKGAHLTYRTSLSPKALFTLRNMLLATGMAVPKSAVSFDPDKLIGKTFGVVVKMKEYDGNEYPDVKEVYNLATVARKETITPSADVPFDTDADEVCIEL